MLGRVVLKYHIQEELEAGESLGLGSSSNKPRKFNLCHQVPQASMNQDKGQGHKVQSCVGTRDKAREGVNSIISQHSGSLYLGFLPRSHFCRGGLG